MIGWTAVVFAIQGWLGETPAQAAAATTPSYLQVGMAAMSLGVVRISRFWRQLVLVADVAKRRVSTTTGNVVLTLSRPTCPFSCLLLWAARRRLVLHLLSLRRVVVFLSQMSSSTSKRVFI